jgi:hypothetical protein
LRSVPTAFCLRRVPYGRSGDSESSPAHHAQQIVELKEGVFETAEEATEEDEKRAEKIAEKSGAAPQKLALRTAIYHPRAISIPRTTRFVSVARHSCRGCYRKLI